MSTSLVETSFSPLTPDTATGHVQPILSDIAKAYGRVPNLMGMMANSPAVLTGYLALAEHWGATSFTPTEREAVVIAVSAENGCEYCVAAHSTIAKHMVKSDPSTIDAVKRGNGTGDPRLDTLVRTARTLTANRGRLSDAERGEFLSAGWTEVQLGELIVGVTLKTFSNYFDHVFPATIDESFRPEAR
jgi:uncharacterized peroxidase-related enzyme